MLGLFTNDKFTALPEYNGYGNGPIDLLVCLKKEFIHALALELKFDKNLENSGAKEQLETYLGGQKITGLCLNWNSTKGKLAFAIIHEKFYANVLHSLGDANFNLGSNTENLHEKIEYYKQAITHYNEALELLPEDSNILRSPGDANFYLGSNTENLHEKIEYYKQAITHYNEALELLPEDSNILHSLGIAKNNLGNIESNLGSNVKDLKESKNIEDFSDVRPSKFIFTGQKRPCISDENIQKPSEKKVVLGNDGSDLNSQSNFSGSKHADADIDTLNCVGSSYSSRTAVMRNQGGIVNTSLEKGADVDAKNKNGETSLCLAKKNSEQYSKNDNSVSITNCLKQIESPSNVTQSESQLSGKAGDKPGTHLNDPIVDNQPQKLPEH